MSWIIALLKFLAGLFLGKPPAPSAEAVASQKLGAASADLATANQTAKTEAAIAQAQANAPASQSAVIDALRKDQF